MESVTAATNATNALNSECVCVVSDSKDDRVEYGDALISSGKRVKKVLIRQSL